MRKIEKLKPLEVEALAASGKIGRHSVGCDCRGALMLVISRGTGGGVNLSWLYRVVVLGRRFDFGLGAYTPRKNAGGLTLAAARDAAAKIAADPEAHAERRKAEREAAALAADAQAGDKCAGLFPLWIEAQRTKKAWKSDKDYVQYLRLLTVHAAPVIGALRPAEVTRAHIVEILTPIYAAGMGGKNCTGDKTRQALSGFFEWCIDKGLRTDEFNPARDASRIRRQLPTQRGARPHFPACPIDDLPRFVALLTRPETFWSGAAMALLFSILTCSRHANICRQERSAEQNFAIWEDIDLTKRVWIIPAHKMKCPANGAHIVPLSGAAVAILERIEALGMKRGAAVFHSGGGRPFSNSALPAQIKRLAAKDKAAGGSGFIDPMQGGRLMTQHGTARATFASWAAREGFDSELVQLALHHRKDEYGYQRNNALKRRRKMMEAWAEFCLRDCPEDWAKVG